MHRSSLNLKQYTSYHNWIYINKLLVVRKSCSQIPIQINSISWARLTVRWSRCPSIDSWPLTYNLLIGLIGLHAEVIAVLNMTLRSSLRNIWHQSGSKEPSHEFCLRKHGLAYLTDTSLYTRDFSNGPLAKVVTVLCKILSDCLLNDWHQPHPHEASREFIVNSRVRAPDGDIGLPAVVSHNESLKDALRRPSCSWTRTLWQFSRINEIKYSWKPSIFIFCVDFCLPVSTFKPTHAR